MLVNTAAVGISNGWTMVVTIVTLPLVLRGLGAVEFGTWALLQTLSAVGGWGSLLDIGLGTATTREVAARHAVDDEQGLGRAVGTSIVAHLGLGLAAGALLAASGPWLLPALFRTPDRLHHELRIAVLAFAVQVVGDLFLGGCQAVMDGYQRVDRSRAVEVLRRTLIGAATTAAALASHRLSTVAIASAGASMAAAAMAAVVARSTTRGTRAELHGGTLRELLRYGRDVAVLRPLGVLHRTVDRLVVGATLGPGAVSMIEVANQLDMGVQAVLSATSYAVVPGAARLDAQGDRHRLRELAETGTRYVLLVCWPLAAIVAVLAAPAIDLWVGDRYADAAGLAALALVSTMLVSPVQVGSNLLLGTGRAREILRVALAGIAVNLVGSIFLVRVVGIAGALQATIASSVISLPLLLTATVRMVGGSAREILWRSALPAVPTLLAGAAGAGLVALLSLPGIPTLALGGALGLSASAAAAWIWGLAENERAAIVQRLRRG